MKILHTSDWHLGQTLITKDRKAEHQQFFDWLLECLTKEAIELLIVAGDIFDSGTPPNYALKLYYNFLTRVSETPCRNVVIVGGNHDSVATLHAPRELLRSLNVHVFGAASEAIDEGILTIKDKNGKPQSIICAVPFLRDRDIRQSLPGETYDEKNKALIDGVKKHYNVVKERAVAIKKEFSENGNGLPLIATGHLFTSGGSVTDSEREIYIGSLGQMNAASFPEEFDYIALGHLHFPQTVGESSHIRYSGSPIPLSFSEAGSEKLVTIVECGNGFPEIKVYEKPVPLFQPLYRIRGNLAEIEEKINSLTAHDGNPVWVEVQVETDTWKSSLQNTIYEMAKDKPVEILALRTVRDEMIKGFSSVIQGETLEQVDPVDVFRKRVEMEKIEGEMALNLTNAFTEILNDVQGEFSEEAVS